MTVTIGRGRHWKGGRTLSTGGYVKVWAPDHPLAMKSGYAYEHRKVAFDAGLLTDLSMQVHHKDHDKTNNDLSNLEVLTRSEHYLAHDLRNLKKFRTHCKHGHEFNEENTCWLKAGGRKCRACGRDYINAWRAKRRIS